MASYCREKINQREQKMLLKKQPNENKISPENQEKP